MINQGDWCSGWNCGGERKWQDKQRKIQEENWFFFTSHPFFLLLNAQNPFLFIGGGRGTSYIYWTNLGPWFGQERSQSLA
jgi:hypothetical protein